MSPDKLSWIIALLTELKDNPDSVLEFRDSRGRWSPIEKDRIPGFAYSKDHYRVVKPKKYRLYKTESGAVGCITSDSLHQGPAARAIERGEGVWLTNWLPLPEAK